MKLNQFYETTQFTQFSQFGLGHSDKITYAH